MDRFSFYIWKLWKNGMQNVIANHDFFSFANVSKSYNFMTNTKTLFRVKINGSLPNDGTVHRLLKMNLQFVILALNPW